MILEDEVLYIHFHFIDEKTPWNDSSMIRRFNDCHSSNYMKRVKFILIIKLSEAPCFTENNCDLF